MNETLEILYRGKLNLSNLTYFKDSEIWRFQFEDKISLDANCFWRFRENNKIIFLSNDHNQIFGLKKHKDLVIEVKEYLKEKHLLEIKRCKNSGDIFLIFEENICPISSTSSLSFTILELSVILSKFVLLW